MKNGLSRQQQGCTSGKPQDANNQAAPLWRIEDLMRFVKLGRSAVYDAIKRGKLPPPTKLSPRCSRWKPHEVIAAIDSVAAAGGAK